MKKLRHGLFSILNTSNLDSPEFRIANYLINNIYKPKKISLSDIADNCFVSKSTVSRFCRRLGFIDYSSILQTMNIAKTKRYRRYDEYTDLDIDQINSLYLSQVTSTLTKVQQYASQEVLDRFIDILCRYNNIGIFGQMQSYAVALNFQSELSSFDKYAVCFPLLTEQENFILKSGSDTLVIVISCSARYFQDFEDSFEGQSDRPHLVLLTNNPRVRICPPFDEVFIIPCGDDTASRPLAIQIFTNLVTMHLARRIHSSSKLEY